MMIASAPASPARSPASVNASRTPASVKSSVGLEQPAERTMIADHESGATVECLPRDGDACAVDLAHLALVGHAG